MKFFITFLLVLASLFGLSYYKNSVIQKTLDDELKHYPQVKYSDLECSGFIKSDCQIKDPKFKSYPLANSITIEGIDPTNIPSPNETKELSANIFVDGAKYSLWDLLAHNNPLLKMGGFYKKHSGDYNISSKFLFGVNGDRIDYVKILSLRADDRFLPYELNGELKVFGDSVKMKRLNLSLDLATKRELFDDYIDSIRKCCKDEMPKEYQNMSNDEIYEQLKLKLKSFHTGLDSLNEIINALSDDDKKKLSLYVESKQDVSIKSMILPFLILGPKAIERFYDIRVEAR